MTERDAFEQAIREDRYDQVVRLVYADWLMERGLDEEAQFQRSWTPEWQRAEDYVRSFCERVDLNYGYFLVEALKHLRGDAEIPCTINTSNATMDEDMGELWRQVGILLKVEVEEGRRSDPFTCGDNCFPDGLSWKDGEHE